MLSLLSERTQPTGVGTFGIELARAMGPLLQADERLIVVRHRDFPSCAGHPFVEECLVSFPARRTLERRLAEQIHLPAWALARRVALVHALNYVLPELWRGPTVLTLHDDRLFTRRAAGGLWDRAVAHGLFVRGVRRATCLMADSSYTADRCATSFGVDRTRIAVAPLGVDAQSFVVGAEDRVRIRAMLDLGDRPVVLSIGEFEPQKNLPRLLDAFAMVAARDARPLLVLAGGRGSVFGEVRARAQALGLAERVRFPPYLARADLRALVAAATLLAYPSIDEGFGLPLLEAFAAGTPVLASPRGALPETAGGAAHFADPLDVEALGTALSQLLQDPALRSSLAARGLSRARECSWSRTAQIVLESYRAIVPEGRRPRSEVVVASPGGRE